MTHPAPLRSTADDVRAAIWRGYWKTRKHQMLIREHFTLPLARLLAERMREFYPEPDSPPAPLRRVE